ncbi:MAG TPA: MobA/MobL family protein [Oscillospiraceae bacterium]|nr:MobA/MobL family protein [Oscillospiraceae bacterium]
MSVANLRVSIGSRQYKSTSGKMRERSALAKILYILRRARHKTAQDLMHESSGNMPYWAAEDPTKFWAAADKHERKNGTLFIEHLLVLPRDLTLEQHIELVERWAETEASHRAYTYAIHYSQSADGGINPHCHFVLNESLQDGVKRGESKFFKRYNAKKPERGGCKKGGTGARTPAENKQVLIQQRQLFEDLCNEALERAQKDTRVSLQSYKNRGLDIVPEPKVGPRGWRNEKIRNEILAMREAKKELAKELTTIQKTQVVALEQYRQIKEKQAALARQEKAQERLALQQREREREQEAVKAKNDFWQQEQAEYEQFVAGVEQQEAEIIDFIALQAEATYQASKADFMQLFVNELTQVAPIYFELAQQDLIGFMHYAAIQADMELDDAVVRVFVEKEKPVLMAQIAERMRAYRQGLVKPQALMYLMQAKEIKESVSFEQLIAELEQQAVYKPPKPDG